MMNELITENEINYFKINARHLSWRDFVPGKGIVTPITRVELKSGYLVSYTIDSIFPDSPRVKLLHVMVSANRFTPDPADMDEIAHAILGDCLRPPAEWSFYGDGQHYIRITGLKTEDLNKFIEAGIELGVKPVGVTR